MYIGFALACFNIHVSGRDCWWRDAWKSKVRIGASSEESQVKSSQVKFIYRRFGINI